MRTGRTVSAALCAALSLLALTACGQTASARSDRLSIVCTSFPEYDWTRHILGGKLCDVDLTCLADNGTDIHSFQPTAGDMIKISACDVFIYVGGESDKWVKDALEEAANPDRKVISLMETLGDSVREEELKEGMEAEEEEEGEEEGPEYDEHVWLSLRNAEKLCTEIGNVLCTADPDNSGEYSKNAKTYTESISELDGKFTELFGSVPEEKKTLIFGDRFPFRYFADDYGLDYYAAFAGCSAETEASFATIAFLAEKADELDADTIYTLEKTDGDIAASVINNTKKKSDIHIVQLDSMQSVTDLNDTYLNIMGQNYEALKGAMS